MGNPSASGDVLSLEKGEKGGRDGVNSSSKVEYVCQFSFVCCFSEREWGEEIHGLRGCIVDKHTGVMLVKLAGCHCLEWDHNFFKPYFLPFASPYYKETTLWHLSPHRNLFLATHETGSFREREAFMGIFNTYKLRIAS